MAEVVFTGVSGDTRLQGVLFRGKKFWLSQKVPQRSRFIADIKANGGEVLLVEKYADVKIVDHARKEALPGTYSYTYIEKSIRNGTLEDLEDHAVGPAVGTVRSVGSVIQPAKTTRTKFTQDDDRVLWLWVEQTPQRGGGTDGNEIYKQLEAKNSRHTWQSWRDRWVKYLKGRPRPAFIPSNAPPTPPSDQPPTEETEPAHVVNQEGQVNKAFSAEDMEHLLSVAEDILDIHPNNTDLAWEAWARRGDPEIHSAKDWQEFWTDRVRPIYLKKTAERSNQEGNPEAPDSEAEAKQVPEKLRPSKDHASEVKLVENSLSHRTGSPHIHDDNTSPSSEATPLSHSEEAEIDPIPLHLPLSQITNVPEPKLKTEDYKRKRAFFDEEEFPSSSPPENPLSSKRQRHLNEHELPVEIASTPEPDPELDEVQSTVEEERPGLLDLDDITTPEGQYDEEDFEDIDNHLGRLPSQILSSPQRPAPTSRTQAIFQNPTQYLDLEVPGPEGGWSGDDADRDRDSPRISDQTPDSDYMPDTTDPNTQALLASKTQVPDFSLPEPDGGWDDIPSSPPIQPPVSPTRSEVSTQVDNWIDGRIASGHSQQNVLRALECTSMDTDLAAKVLERLRKGKGVPRDVRGVWTESDDENLEATDARKLERLERKHGGEGVKTRWDFLRYYRAGG